MSLMPVHLSNYHFSLWAIHVDPFQICKVQLLRQNEVGVFSSPIVSREAI